MIRHSDSDEARNKIGIRDSLNRQNLKIRMQDSVLQYRKLKSRIRDSAQICKPKNLKIRHEINTLIQIIRYTCINRV